MTYGGQVLTNSINSLKQDPDLNWQENDMSSEICSGKAVLMALPMLAKSVEYGILKTKSFTENQNRKTAVSACSMHQN